MCGFFFKPRPPSSGCSITLDLLHFRSPPLAPWFENQRPSYRAETPQTQNRPKYQPDIYIPLTAGDRNNTPKILAPANLQKCVGGFWLYKFWRIFPGSFRVNFSGLFSHKNEEKKIRRENPRKNPAAQKEKSAKNPFCRKPALKIPEKYPQKTRESYFWGVFRGVSVGGSQKGGFQKGGFGGCSPGTRVRSPKPPFYETALLSPSDPFWC